MGALLKILSHLEEGDHFSGEERDLVMRRGRILRSFLPCWRVGHDRSIDAGRLRELGLVGKGLVTETFLPRFAEFLEEHDGDARILIQAIQESKRTDPRVKGVSKELAPKLFDRLQEEGYLDDREPFDLDGLVAEVLDSFSGRAIDAVEVRLLVEYLGSACGEDGAVRQGSVEWEA